MRTVPVHMYIVVPVRLNFQFHLFQFLIQTDSEKSDDENDEEKINFLR